MNLFAIGESLWRHKRATIPVILLTVIGMFYAIAIRPPTYEASASILLTNPPAPPTAAQIAADPSLAHVNADNPFVDLGNLVFVADALIEVVTSPAAQQALVQAGASRQYQVALDVSAESPPAIDVTGVASNAQAAIQSAQLVAKAVSQDLYRMQAGKHVDTKYMISSTEYVQPTSATTSSSGKLRTTILVAVVGFILLLVAVSVSQVLEERKNGNRRQRRKAASRTGGHDEPVSSPTAGMYDQFQRDTVRMGESQPARHASRPDIQPASGNAYWTQID